MYGADRIGVEDISSAAVIKRIKDELKNPANKIEGSFASDNAQAVGKEMAKYYAYIAWLQDMHYVDTAEGRYLDRKAAEVGITRKGATRARGVVRCYGRPGTMVRYGDTFYSDTQTFTSLETASVKEGEEYVDVTVLATEAGEYGNVAEGAIDKTDARGFTRVENLKPTYGGADIEGDDSLRERTLLKMRYPGTSGNKYHYMHWATEVEGVGRVKVFPEWNGPGTVKVSILNRTQNVASEELMSAVKEHIDPTDGGGDSLAPIGATLTVSTATPVAIDVDAKITLVDIPGYEVDSIREAFEAFLDEHLRSISYVESTLSLAKVIDVLWTIEGVGDIPEITINGDAKNLRFDAEEIPVVGEINLSLAV